MSDRQWYEEKYNSRKVEGDDIHNASLCDELADDCTMWNSREDEECDHAAVSQEQEKVEAEESLDVSSESLFSGMDFFLELEKKIGSDRADELKDMIISYTVDDLLGAEDILEFCKEYLEEYYPDVLEKLKEDELRKIVSEFRSVVINIEKQEGYLKLDAAFGSLKKKGIMALHCMEYYFVEDWDSNQFVIEGDEYEDEKWLKSIGRCFYTWEDLENTLCKGWTRLYLSFGNHFENPSAEEVGEMIVGELEKEGLSVSWDHSAGEKIVITNFIWTGNK